MRRTILALLLAVSMVAVSPATAAEEPVLGLEGIWTWLVSFWSSDQERGLGLDPDGLTVNRGLEIDPDGATWEDRGAGIDPGGLSAGGERVSGSIPMAEAPRGFSSLPTIFKQSGRFSRQPADFSGTSPTVPAEARLFRRSAAFWSAIQIFAANHRHFQLASDFPG